MQLERSARIDVACCLITPMVTGGVGASANLDPLDFAAAAHAVLTDKGVLQRGSLVDVLCWNAERLVQAVLLAFGRVQPPKGRITVDCVPPDPPTFGQPLLDRNDTDVGRKARTDASIKAVIDAVVAHRYHLRTACTKQLKARQKCIDAYVKKLEFANANEKRVEAELIVDTTGVLVEGVEADIDDEHVAGLHEMLKMMDIGASQDPTDVGYDAYTTEQAEWSDAYTATFLDTEAILAQPSLGEALAYHCAHETKRVYELLKKEYVHNSLQPAIQLAKSSEYEGEERIAAVAALGRIMHSHEKLTQESIKDLLMLTAKPRPPCVRREATLVLASLVFVYSAHAEQPAHGDELPLVLLEDGMQHPLELRARQRLPRGMATGCHGSARGAWP